MEKIKYFGMYLGAKVEHSYPDKSYNEGTKILTLSKLAQIGDPATQDDKYWSSVKYYTLLLRTLSSLTDEEKVGWYDLVLPDRKDNELKVYFVNEWIKKGKYSAASISHLLSLHIDLFGLIEKGWAKELITSKTSSNAPTT